MRGDLPGALDAAVRAREGKLCRGAEGDRDPQGLASWRWRAIIAGGAGDDRRLGRPHRLQQHPHQGDEGDVGRRLCRPLHPLRHPRARHGRGDERHGAAWRPHPLLRHVPGLLRLLPPGDPPRGADGRARHLRDDARLDRPWRGRPDAPAGRASGGAARDPEPARLPPADAVETAECWQLALEARETPERAGADAAEPAAAAPRRSTSGNRCAAGAYEISPADGKAQVSIFATGSEVEIAVDAQKLLTRQGHRRARRLGAVLRAVPRAAGRRTAAPMIGDAPVRSRSRPRSAWAGTPIIGSDGALRRHAGLRRQRALQGPLQAFRHHAEAVADAQS